MTGELGIWPEGLYRGAMSDPQVATAKATPIVSAVLRDGTLVEAVYRSESNRTILLVSNGKDIREQEQLHLPGVGRVTPYSATNNLLTHAVVRLPSAADNYDSDEELLSAIRSFIHRFADLSESFEEVASHYVLLTWVYDAFNEIPYLRIRGDYGSGKSRTLLTIGSLCYKPMFASGASTVSPLFRIIDAFRGTLVIDESDFRYSDEKSEIIKILNNGNAVGFPVLRSETTPGKEFNPTAFTVYGPKIIATRKPFDDAALESRCITEVMSGLPPRPDIPLSLPSSFHQEALALRNQLLMYRFRNRHTSRDLDYSFGIRVEPRIAQMFAPLLSIARSEPERDRLRALAREKSGALAADRGASIEAQLLDIICQMRRESVPLGIKEIAERYHRQFGNDSLRPITPRWIGSQLRNRLSLVPVKIHGTFAVAAQDQKLEALFERYRCGKLGAV